MPKSQYEIDHEARIVLENLTPSGSEFHNDPQRCKEYLQKLKEHYFDARISLVRMKRQQDTLISALEHCLSILQSQAIRGRYPEECDADSVHFLGIQGFDFINEAISQAKRLA